MLYNQFQKQTHHLHLTARFTQYSTSQFIDFILTFFLHTPLENLTETKSFKSKEEPIEIQRFIFNQLQTIESVKDYGFQQKLKSPLINIQDNIT